MLVMELVVDESDLRSTHWFRVRLPGPDPDARAWLPAVRTEDRPELPNRPTPMAS